MSRKRKELSGEEIWDDAALQTSWEEALEEYKLYHSIHAKGERVEDVMNSFEGNNNPQSSTMYDDIAVPAQENRGGQDVDIEDHEWQGSFVDPRNDQHGAYSTNMAATAAPFPQHVVNDVKDDALRNLMMSWYWAGYYTGFHQGKQQLQAS